jgi:hypothetical protein
MNLILLSIKGLDGKKEQIHTAWSILSGDVRRARASMFVTSTHRQDKDGGKKLNWQMNEFPFISLSSGLLNVTSITRGVMPHHKLKSWSRQMVLESVIIASARGANKV